MDVYGVKTVDFIMLLSLCYLVAAFLKVPEIYISYLKKKKKRNEQKRKKQKQQ